MYPVTWVDEDIDILQDFLVPVTSPVFLAENVTVVPINHVINLTLSFIDCELQFFFPGTS